MKITKLECSMCGIEFEKPMNEYRRRLKLGKTEFYCSLSCSGNRDANIKMLYNAGAEHHFVGGENKLITEEQKILSSMREFSRRIRRRGDKFIDDLGSEKLREIWEYQNGKCRYTGVRLMLPHEENYKSTSNNYKASIDRIDSSKPYTPDNIQFVSVTCNYMKHNMTESEVFEYFNIIKNNISTIKVS